MDWHYCRFRGQDVEQGEIQFLPFGTSDLTGETDIVKVKVKSVVSDSLRPHGL